MNKNQMKWKENHLAALQAFFTNAEVESKFIALRRLEEKAHRFAEMYCNVENFDMESAHKNVIKAATRIFNGKLPAGFFFNQDPRGYALKIDNDSVLIPEGLHTDWGGYGILAPDFSDMN
jgi:hypothetical protein